MGKTTNHVEEAVLRAAVGRCVLIAFADEIGLAKAILVCRDLLSRRRGGYHWSPERLMYALPGGGYVQFVAIKRDADGFLVRPNLDDLVPRHIRAQADLEFDHYATYQLDREEQARRVALAAPGANEITVDTGSPEDLELFDASLDGETVMRNGWAYIVEYVSGTLDGSGRGTRVYRLINPASYDWDHGSNESFAP